MGCRRGWGSGCCERESRGERWRRRGLRMCCPCSAWRRGHFRRRSGAEGEQNRDDQRVGACVGRSGRRREACKRRLYGAVMSEETSLVSTPQLCPRPCTDDDDESGLTRRALGRLSRSGAVYGISAKGSGRTGGRGRRSGQGARLCGAMRRVGRTTRQERRRAVGGCGRPVQVPSFLLLPPHQTAGASFLSVISCIGGPW